MVSVKAKMFDATNAGSLRQVLVSLMCLAVSLSAMDGARAQDVKLPDVAAPSAPARRVVLRVLTEADFPPFNYYDDEGVLTGFNVDLSRALCLELTVTCDIQVRKWEELLPAIAKGEGDAVIAGHVVTAKALRTVDFTDRYFHTAARFAGRRDGAKLEITPDGIEGKRIGVTKATAHEAYLTEFFRLGRITSFDSAEATLDALLQGKIDLVFDDGIALALWINGTASKECCELRGGPFLEPRYFGEGIAIAVPKTDPELKLQLNGALRRVRSSGRFDELVMQYFRTRLY